MILKGQSQFDEMVEFARRTTGDGRPIDQMERGHGVFLSALGRRGFDGLGGQVQVGIAVFVDRDPARLFQCFDLFFRRGVVAALAALAAGVGIHLGIGIGLLNLQDAVGTAGCHAGPVHLGILVCVCLAGLFALLDSRLQNGSDGGRRYRGHSSGLSSWRFRRFLPTTDC